MIEQAMTNLFGGYSNRNGQNFIVENRVERLPTEAEQQLIDDETLRLETEQAANAYKKLRATEYPSIQDQLDMQYWDSVNGTTTWATAIAKVKTDNPKP
jgi:hypothetical protein